MVTADKDLAMCGSALLRAALRRNLVSFPAQVPALTRSSSRHLEQKVAMLYFVNGWTVTRIGQRYGMPKKLVQNLIADWRIRAVAAGLIQEVDAEGLAELVATFDPRNGQSPETQVETEDSEDPGRLLRGLKLDCIRSGIRISGSQLRLIKDILSRKATGVPESRDPGDRSDSGHTPQLRSEAHVF